MSDTYTLPTPDTIRKDFPIFKNNPGMIYLDNGATAQKSAYCIDGISHYLQNDYANIHRGDYGLSHRSEELFWQSRQIVARCMDVRPDEVIFTGNATHASNILVDSLVASSMLQQGDRIVLSQAEHHANIVPRQIAAKKVGATIERVPVMNDGTLDYASLTSILAENPKILALSSVSNVTGTLLDCKKIGALCGEETLFVVDASQSMPHGICDLADRQADFCRRTGHKLGALPGIGVLRGKKSHLDRMQPAQGGGGVIADVTTDGFIFLGTPNKFEPGTPNLTGVISLKLALEYLLTLTETKNTSGSTSDTTLMSPKPPQRLRTLFDRIETPLIAYCLTEVEKLKNKGVIVVGSTDPTKKIGVFSLLIDPDRAGKGKSAVGLSQFLATKNICVRAGGQCAHPLHTALNHGPTCRMSLWIYNTLEDCEVFFDGVREYLSK